MNIAGPPIRQTPVSRSALQPVVGAADEPDQVADQRRVAVQRVARRRARSRRAAGGRCAARPAPRSASQYAATSTSARGIQPGGEPPAAPTAPPGAASGWRCRCRRPARRPPGTWRAAGRTARAARCSAAVRSSAPASAPSAIAAAPASASRYRSCRRPAVQLGAEQPARRRRPALQPDRVLRRAARGRRPRQRSTPVAGRVDDDHRRLPPRRPLAGTSIQRASRRVRHADLGAGDRRRPGARPACRGRGRPAAARSTARGPRRSGSSRRLPTPASTAPAAPCSPHRTTGSAPSMIVASAGHVGRPAAHLGQQHGGFEHAEVVAAQPAGQRQREQPRLGQRLPGASPPSASGRGSTSAADVGDRPAGPRRARSSSAGFLPGQAEHPLGHEREQDLAGAARDAQAPGQQEARPPRRPPRRRRPRRPRRRSVSAVSATACRCATPSSLRTAAVWPASVPRRSRPASRSSITDERQALGEPGPDLVEHDRSAPAVRRRPRREQLLDVLAEPGAAAPSRLARWPASSARPASRRPAGRPRSRRARTRRRGRPR